MDMLRYPHAVNADRRTRLGINPRGILSASRVSPDSASIASQDVPRA